MIHPVGEHAPSVYWRRRALLVLAALLSVVTVFTVFSGGGDKKTSGTVAPGSSTSSSNTGSPQTQTQTQTSTSLSGASTAPISASTPGSTTNSTTAPLPCLPANLKVGSSTDAVSYKVGGQPVLALVVINTGPAPCVQDLADGQIELKVFSGSARVWGSHDCAVQPGRSLQTLPVGSPIKREIQWSGLSSQPGCAGVRTRVSAGVYDLVPALSGHVGAPTRFSFAP